MRRTICNWFGVILGWLCLAEPSEVSAQNVMPSIEWERLHYGLGSSGNLISPTIAQSGNGGYILGGALGGSLLAKFNAQGQTQWERTYGGTGSEDVRFLRQTSDGGYIFTGISTSPVSGDREAPPLGGEDVWVVKVDALGNKQWDRSFGGTGHDAPEGIWPSADGYMLAGVSPGDNGSGDFWLIKLNAQGVQVSKQIFGSENVYLGADIKQTGDGGYVLTGVTGFDTPHFGEGDGWLMKTDGDGKRQWEKIFGGTERDSFNSVDVSPDGGFILGGRSRSPSSGNKESPQIGGDDYWIVKVDAVGNKVWDRTYGSGNNEGAQLVRQAVDSGYIFAGNLGSGTTEVVKVDAEGNRQWTQVLGKPRYPPQPYTSFTMDLQPTPEGGYLLCGQFSDPSVGAPGIFGALVAKLERVVWRSGQVVSWKSDAGVVLEMVEDLGGEWAVDEGVVLSIGEAKAVVVEAGGQKRFYRLRATDGASSLPALAPGALLSWPVELNQILEVSAGKDGPWQSFSGDQGASGPTNYAIIPQELQQRYFRTRRSGL